MNSTHTLLVALATQTAFAAMASAGAAPVACATFTKADAIGWLGGPLADARNSDQLSNSDSGRPRLSACIYFPPGYDAANAEGPPERGLHVTLMAMPDAAAARQRFTALTSGVPGAPPVHGTPLRGIADQAVLEHVKLPAPGTEMVRLKFRQGDVAGSVQVWAKAGDPAAIARIVAAQVVSRLR